MGPPPSFAPQCSSDSLPCSAWHCTGCLQWLQNGFLDSECCCVVDAGSISIYLEFYLTSQWCSLLLAPQWLIAIPCSMTLCNPPVHNIATFGWMYFELIALVNLIWIPWMSSASATELLVTSTHQQPVPVDVCLSACFATPTSADVTWN
jgi:hypothetical protein